ncbi:hypothetical protein MAR_033050 [Mya arenaria]|uniref:Uncharacterized protein n=1 Tax=Mya arenaria TaxID=6604 RepID=A0ABY7G7W0_MYAAR|nr:uncharacterized protein LOC128223672 [Mya arenaria]WAR30508.1 hypothetical protein MAR_033050 [Mya arenaria]
MVYSLCNRSSKKGRKISKGRKRNARKLKKEAHAKNIVVEDTELMSREQLKKLSEQPTNNIRVSGKRKHKVLKRLRHSEKIQKQMDVEVPTQSKDKKKKQKDEVSMATEGTRDSDVEMT